MKELKTCPCCGYSNLEEPVFKSELPNFGFICPCCFYEFGIEEETFVGYRKEWISYGSPFRDVKIFSNDEWTLQKAINQLDQLQDIQWELMPEKMKQLNPDWTAEYDRNELERNW